MAASKEADVVQIDWHELLDRSQKMRSKASRSIFEERRRAFIAKSVEIVERQSDGNDGDADNNNNAGASKLK